VNGFGFLSVYLASNGKVNAIDKIDVLVDYFDDAD
jgi:hypothetical protein